MLQNRTLFFGDNLEILREKFPDKTDGDGYFDLIYLDPPFNSNKDYNVLFKESLTDSQAQVQAFADSWHWTEDAQSTFEELVGAKPTRPMVEEAVSAGTFSVNFSKEEFPKIQIITIDDLLNGKTAKLPLLAGPYYKQAKKIEIDEFRNQGKLEF